MRAQTSQCRTFGQPEITVQWSGNDHLTSWANRLLSWLQTEVAAGRRFLPEQTVQFGWSIMEVRQRTDGLFALFESDFSSLPIVFVDSVSNTLHHTMLQKFVVESVASANEMEFPSMLQTCVVCSRFGDKGDLILERQEPSNSQDSGWLFGCQQSEHSHNSADELQVKSLYEAAACIDSRVIPFLALPIGFRIDLEKSGVFVAREGRIVEIKPGSYLAEKYGVPR
jgi:hypothetical protein